MTKTYVQVLELLPYKWEWANLSMLHYNMTESVGDIHHFAWRPQHYKFAYYTVRLCRAHVGGVTALVPPFSLYAN